MLQTYPARLGMPILQIDKIKQIIFEDIKRSIENNLLNEKQTFHIVGPAGVGKTQITFQLAEKLSEYFKIPFHIKKINAPVLCRDDFLIPFPTSDNDFKMLYSDFIPKKDEEYGLFVIDEASRGDQQLQQMMWQVQNECQLHTYKFPKGWFIIAIDNPDDDNYQLNNMEDAAGLRRCLHFYTKVSTKVFLNYAINKKFHKFVINYLKTYPEKLYDFDAQKQGQIFANPASWEKISNHLYKYNDDIFNNINNIEMICAGLLNIFQSKHFCNFIMNQNKIIIKPSDIFNDYENIRKHIKKYVENGANDKLHEILQSYITYLCENQPKQKNENIKNTLNFLMDIPSDIAAGFITYLNNLTLGSEKHLYIMQLLVKMNKNKTFKNKFFDKLSNLGN